MSELLFSAKMGWNIELFSKSVIYKHVHCNLWEWVWLTVHRIKTLDYPNFIVYPMAECLDFGVGQRGLDNRGWTVQPSHSIFMLFFFSKAVQELIIYGFSILQLTSPPKDQSIVLKYWYGCILYVYEGIMIPFLLYLVLSLWVVLQGQTPHHCHQPASAGYHPRWKEGKGRRKERERERERERENHTTCILSCNCNICKT